MRKAFSFVAALVCAVLLAAPAQAGAVVTAVALIANGVSFGAALTASFGAFGAFLIKAAIGVVFNVAAQMLSAPKQKVKVNGIQTEQTTTGDVTPQKFIVGRYATEGHLVAPAYTHGPMNGKLTYIIELSNAPIEGLTGRIAIDGARYDIEDDPGKEHADYGWPMKGLNRKFDNTPAAWVKWYDGTQTTADEMLVDKYGSHPDRPWTTDHILEGTAYAIMTFQYAESVFSGLPTVRFEVDGMPLYDPRKDTTVGGSGSHRWNDDSTWEFTRNPQVISYNIFRGITLPGGDIYGGEVPASAAPLDDWFAAMNECDELIGSRVQYQAGFEIDVSTEPQEIITELNKASFTQIAQFGGTFRPRTGAPAAPVLSITDDDLLVTHPSELTPFPGLDQTYNAITGTYVEPASIYKGTQIDPILNSEWETDDGDRRLSLDMGLPAVTDVSQAKHLLNSYINDNRRFRTHRLALSPVAGLIKPLDAIEWTSASNGYTDKVFEVVEVEYGAVTGVILATVRERDASDVGWSSGDDVEAPSDHLPDALPDAYSPTLTVEGVSISDSDSEARRPAMKLSWPDSEVELIDSVHYEVRLLSSEAMVASGTVDAKVGEVVVSEGIVANEIYEARARYMTGQYPSAWSAWVPATSPDTRLSAKDIVDAYNAKVDTAFDRHDQALSTLTTGTVFQLLNESRIEDAILAAQEVTGKALAVVEREYAENTTATITNDYYTSAETDSAIAGQLVTFKSDIENPNGTSLGATLAQSYRTEVDTDQAISTAVQNLKTTLEDPNGTSLGADISTIQATKVDASGAVGAVEQQISADYGSLSAMANATAFAKAQADGIESGFVVQLNHQNLLEIVSVQDGVGGTPISTARLSPDYVQITGLAQINQAVINALAVDTGFISNLTIGSAQLEETIQSTNYVSGTSGWQIKKSGDAEFNSLTVRRDMIAPDAVTDRVNAYITTPAAVPKVTGSRTTILAILTGPISYGEVWHFTASGAGAAVGGGLVTVMWARRAVKYSGSWSAWKDIPNSTNDNIATGWKFWNFFEILSGTFDDVKYELQVEVTSIGTGNTHTNCQLAAERARR